MIAFGILILLLPVILLAIAVVGAWIEGRGSPYPFGIGRVLSNAFSAVGGAPVPLLAASALLNAPLQFVAPMMARNIGAPEQMGGLVYAMAPFGLLWLLLYPFVHLFMLRIALDTLAGRPIDLPATLRMALRRMLPGLGLILLFGIAAAIGFALLIVPGLILTLTWCIAMPVMAEEGRGVFGCFARSAELMRGMRWRLLLLLVIVAILWIMFSGLAQVLALAIAGAGNLWALAVAEAITSTLIGVVTATGIAAVYHEARTAKEGLGSHDLEAVFA